MIKESARGGEGRSAADWMWFLRAAGIALVGLVILVAMLVNGEWGGALVMAGILALAAVILVVWLGKE